MTHKPSYDSIPTRHSLLLRLKDWGDQSGWQEFFDSYWALLYNTSRRAGLNDTEAQEAVQETVIAVSKKMPEFKVDPSRGSFSAWLLQLARWRIADQFRIRARAEAKAAPQKGLWAGDSWETAVSDDSAATDPLQCIPDLLAVPLETIWNEEWERNLITAALERVKSQVNARQYQMFDLHKLQGLSAGETARSMKVSAASVYMAAFRVSRLLNRVVKEIRKTVE